MADSGRMAHQPGTALLRLLQLVSPALPIGAYHFSQGLEYAIEADWVRDEETAGDWIAGLASHTVGTLDLPMLLRLYAAWDANDDGGVRHWNALLVAARETAELRAEERHLGAALAKILLQGGLDEARPWVSSGQAAFATLFALAAVRWRIPSRDAACGYLWMWVENQVLAAVKLIPLGQSAGQRLVNRLLPGIPEIAAHAWTLKDDDIAISSPLQGIASALHETQYSRLFRS